MSSGNSGPSATVQIDVSKLKELRKLVEDGMQTKVGLPPYASSIVMEDILKQAYDQRGETLLAVNRWIGDNCGAI